MVRMRWLLIVIGVVALAVLLFWLRDDNEATRGERNEVRVPVLPTDAGESGVKEREEAGKPVTLRGVVVDEEERPIAGATLEVVRGEGVVRETTTSDALGQFRFEIPPQPRMAVQARHPDYVTGVGYYQAPNSEAERRIVLVRGTRYGLRVVGPDRKPVAAAAVSVTRDERHGVAGMWSWEDAHDLASGETDVDGMFALGALPLGTVELKVVGDGFAVHRESIEVLNQDAVEHLVVLNRGGAIEGRVFGPGDEPVEGARVFTDDREALSDATGRYRIERVGAGPATVRAEKVGFGPGYFGARIGWDQPIPVQVVVGAAIPGVDIYLGPASWVIGRIVDEKGAPLSGVEVHAPVWGAFALKDESASAEDGRFVAGPYHVTEPSPLHLYIRKVGFVTLQPEPRDLAPAQRLDVGDLKLLSSPPVVGRVVNAEGAGVPGATVHAQPNYDQATTGPDGRFELPVPFAVKLTLFAMGPPSSPGRSVPRLVDAQPGRPREELVLTLLAPLVIRGRVTDEKGSPRKGATLIARRAEGDQSSHEFAGADEDGRYEFENLAPGRFKVGIVGTGGLYFWGDSPWVEDPPPVEVDAGAEEVDFVYPYTGGIVTARVVSKRTGRPIRQFQHGLIRYRMLIPQFTANGETDNAEGKFRAEFEEEGSWAIEFQADGHASYRTPRLTLKKGEVTDLGTIRLGEGATLVGIVKDAQGLPVPYTRINILSPKFETNDDEPFTGLDGRFRIPSISPGLYNVFAVSPQHPIAFVRNIQLGEGETTEVEVQFESPAPLEICVRDSNASPIEDASLSFSFPAIAPLSSKLFRDKIPPGYGSHKSDAEGRIVQHSLPAGPVTLTVEAEGFTPVTKELRLAAGENTRLEITLAPKK